MPYLVLNKLGRIHERIGELIENNEEWTREYKDFCEKKWKRITWDSGVNAYCLTGAKPKLYGFYVERPFRRGGGHRDRGRLT